MPISLSPSSEESRSLLADHNAGRHRIACRDARQNRRIRNAEPIDAIDLQFPVNYRHCVATHLRCTRLVPEGAKAVAEKALQFGAVERARRDLAFRERP